LVVAQEIEVKCPGHIPYSIWKAALNSREMRKFQLLAEPVHFQSGRQIIAQGELAADRLQRPANSQAA
jgi:hypothetical protein